MTGHDQHSRKQQSKLLGQSSNSKLTGDVKAEHSLRDVSFTAQLKPQGSQTAEAILQTEARRLLLDSNPDLAERRKALAKAAFVRYVCQQYLTRILQDLGNTPELCSSYLHFTRNITWRCTTLLSRQQYKSSQDTDL